MSHLGNLHALVFLKGLTQDPSPPAPTGSAARMEFTFSVMLQRGCHDLYRSPRGNLGLVDGFRIVHAI